MMIKAMITPEAWEELEKVLIKHQIGYTVSFDAHGKDHREKLIAMNPIGVQYYEESITQTATGVPKAKWIPTRGSSDDYKCSNCNEYANSYEDGYSRDHYFLTHFCPECGAEMENWEG